MEYVIYKVTCSCNIKYICKTGRPVDQSDMEKQTFKETTAITKLTITGPKI